jgi:hypothetical protein
VRVQDRTREPSALPVAGPTGVARLRAFVREATATFRESGLRGTLRRYGWKLFAAFFVFYLVRDLTLYVLLPYLAARGALSLWR